MSSPSQSPQPRRAVLAVRLTPHQTSSTDGSRASSPATMSSGVPTPLDTPQPPPESVLVSRHIAAAAGSATTTAATTQVSSLLERGIASAATAESHHWRISSDGSSGSGSADGSPLVPQRSGNSSNSSRQCGDDNEEERLFGQDAVASDSMHLPAFPASAIEVSCASAAASSLSVPSASASPEDDGASSHTAAAADASSSSSTKSNSRLMTVMAWLSLLVAVFSMSAVGPMFLYLEKRGLTAMRAVFWRQTIQVLSSLLPMLLEHLWTPKSERAWWHLRVMQGKDEDFALEEERRIAREKEQRRRARRLAQGECEEESAQSQSHQLSLSPVDADGSMPKRPSRLSRKRRGAYAAAATSDGGASPSSTGAGAVERRGSNSDLTLSLEGDDDFDGSSQSPQQHHHQLQAPTPARVAGRNVWQSLFVISFCWFASVSLWVIALPYTSAARASLFSSLYPLFVICYLKLWRKVPVSAGEFGGVAVCVAGIAISELMASLAPDTNTMAAQAALQARQQRDAAAAAAALNSTALNGTVATIPEALLEDSHAAFLQFIGDALCVLGSIFIAYNVLEGSPCRKAVPLFAYTTITSVGCWIFLLVATVSLEGTTLSMHPVDGAFGWLADTEMTVRIILFGFLVGMVGISGFNFAVAHMSPILFSTVQLLDPGLAGIMSAMFGIEGWPVGSTYLGVGLVTAGIFLVVLYQTRRETEAEQTRAEEKRRMEMDSDDEDEGEGKGKELHEVREKDLDLHDSSSTLRPRRPSIRQISISDHKDEEAELDAAAMELSAHGSGGGGRGSGRGDGFVAIGRTASDSLGDEDEDVDVDGDVRSPRTKKGRGRAAAYSRVEMQTVANSPASLQHEA